LDAAWAWSLPLIAINVVLHVFVLGFLTQMAEGVLNGLRGQRGFLTMFALTMSVIVTLVAILHGIEAIIWAIAYRMLGALPNSSAAMLYSLNAMTSYGHEHLTLEPQWKLMGALEALNGMLLFGLSTAFLFNMIRKIRITYQVRTYRRRR